MAIRNLWIEIGCAEVNFLDDVDDNIDDNVDSANIFLFRAKLFRRHGNLKKKLGSPPSLERPIWVPWGAQICLRGKDKPLFKLPLGQLWAL